MLRGHRQRGMHRLLRTFAVPSAVNSATVTPYMSGRRLKRSVKSRMNVLPRGVTGRGPKQSTLDSNAGPFRQAQRDDGPPDRQPRGFPCLVFQAVARPPPGADAHTNPPVKTFEPSQSARRAEVAGSCRMASLHDPRAHDQRYVNVNRLMVQQTSRASHRAL